MKPYEYIILRYRHDRITGEFINIGIILFVREERVLYAQMLNKFKRISDFFPGIKASELRGIMKNFDNFIEKLHNRINEELDLNKFDSLSHVLPSIMPLDDSAIFYSEVKNGISLDYKKTISDLYDKIVARYELSKEKRSWSDDDVWRRVYKDYFDRFRLTNKLMKHNIKTKNDNFDFDYCWKNGIWHIYKPLSFDLADLNSFKDKLYRWNGIANELKLSEEPINFTILTKRPKLKSDLDLTQLMNDKLETKSDVFNSKLVFDDNIDEFIMKLKKEIEAHDN